MSFNEKMTAIANETRFLIGSTDLMGLDDIAQNLNDANAEVDTQTYLLQQVIDKVNNLPEAGEGSANLQTANVSITTNVNLTLITYTSIIDGVATPVTQYSSQQGTINLQNIQVNTSINILLSYYASYDTFSITGGLEQFDTTQIGVGNLACWVLTCMCTGNGSINITVANVGCCFVAGTQVLTSLNGDVKSIEDMQSGDAVASYNVETGEVYMATVRRTIINQHTVNIAEVFLEDGTLITMNEYHPIYTKEGFHSITNYNGYDELVVGDEVKTLNGWVKVVNINRYKSDPMVTYNLDVIDIDEDPDNESNDTFFANGVVVHNGFCSENGGNKICQIIIFLIIQQASEMF